MLTNNYLFYLLFNIDPMLPDEYMQELEFFEQQIGYSFTNKSLLKQAFTSKAYSNEHKNCPHCQSFAALGDGLVRVFAVKRAIELGFTEKGEISLFSDLFEKGENQGLMLWQSFVSFSIENEKILLLSKGEYDRRMFDKEPFLERFFEAIIGAVYLDSNLDNARAIFLKLMSQYIVLKYEWEEKT